MKRSDHYAGNQVRFFLGELKNGTHPSKVKAVQHFQNYIKTYQPNISDDSVDFLYTGRIDEMETEGLLEWCGVASEKHAGQLKRICAPLITLLRWLVSYEDDNIFYERFVHLSVEDLRKVSFSKHILRSDNKLGLSIPGQSRSGSSEDACELLSILLLDHRNLEDEPDPIDIGYLLDGSKAAQDRFEEWLQKSNLEHINQTLNALKSTPAAAAALTIKRPKVWSDVAFKVVPLQEGEEGAAEEDDGPVEPPPVKDPMDLDERDLRVIQELYSSGRLAKSALQKRASVARMSVDGMMALNRSSTASNVASAAQGRRERDGQGGGGNANEDEGNSGDEDDDDDDDDGPLSAVQLYSKEKKALPSVLPGDKSFSVPLYLSLVHGMRSFDDLKLGLERLEEYQRLQSSRRENLVRQHFGLFVQCADGLEWLKLYRKGIFKKNELPKNKTYRRSSLDERMSRAKNTLTVDQGMQKLRTAQQTLESAKIEAKSTLAPILERMKQSREIRSAEKVLRSLAVLLEYPHSMRLALDRGDFREVVALYQRVQNIPSSSSFKIILKIKAAAEGVVQDLRRLCFTQLLAPPNGGYNAIAKYATLILSLDGPSAYVDVLRQTLSRQVIGFWDSIRKTKDRFCTDITEAFDRGTEYNLMVKNRLLNAADRDNLLALLRRFSPRVRSRDKDRDRGSVKRQQSVNAGSSFTGPTPGRRSFSKGSFSSGSLPLEEELDLELLSDDLSDDSTPEQMFGRPEHSTSFYIAHDRQPLGGMGGGGGEDEDGIDGVADFAELLCSAARRAFAQSLIDITAHWFPLLYKLVYEIAAQQTGKSASATSTSAAPSAASASAAAPPQSSPALLLGQLGKQTSVSVVKAPPRASCNRLVAGSLIAVVDLVQQAVSGTGGASRPLSLPHEVVHAISDLDSYIASINSSYSTKIQLTAFDTDLSNDTVNPAHLGEVFNSGLLSGPLRPTDYQEALGDCFQLYDALENAMTTAYQALCKQAASSSPAHPPASTGMAASALFRGSDITVVTPSYGSNSVPNTSAAAELDYTQPISPYFEAMQALSNLAREEEVMQTQKTLDRLLDRAYSLGDVFLADTAAADPDEDLAPVSSSAKVRQSEGSHLRGVEMVVADLESLLLKALDVLKARVKRPDWVASLVFDTFFQKILLSFVEKLRRKTILIEEARVKAHDDDFTMSPIASPNTKRSRKKTVGGGNTRGSMHQSQLILQALEEDLRCLELGWIRNDRSARNNAQGPVSSLALRHKASAWMDYLKGLIRLRSYSLPIVLRQLLQVFPAVARSAGSGAAAPPKGGSAGSSVPSTAASGSLLNRLFAFDSVVESTSLSVAAPASASGGGGTSAIGSTHSKSLYDRILSGTTAKCRSMQSSSNLEAWAAVQGSLSAFGEIAQLESDAVGKYVSHRSAGLRAILHSAYALLSAAEAREESQRASEDASLPAHISRIILAINEEKRLLSDLFGNIMVETGGEQEDYTPSHEASQGGINGESKSKEAAAEDFDDGDDRIIQTIRPGLPSPSGKFQAFKLDKSEPQLYSTFLYSSLCSALLDQYEDLIKKLASDVSLPMAKRGRCLHQSLEEWEFFKAVLPEDQVSRKQPLGVSELAQYKEKSDVSCDALKAIGQLMILLL